MRRLASRTRDASNEDTLASLLKPLRDTFGDSASAAAFWREYFEERLRRARAAPDDTAAHQFVSDTLMSLWRLEQLARDRRDRLRSESLKREEKLRACAVGAPKP